MRFDRNHMQMLWLAGYTAAEAKVMYVADAKDPIFKAMRAHADVQALWDFWDRQAARVKLPC